MNVLYIGPYTSNQTVGYSSLDIIQSLEASQEISELTIRPFVLNELIPNKEINNEILKNLARKVLSNQYDVIIQHSTISALALGYNVCKKNIAIPIFNKFINAHNNIQKLQGFDLVLSDDIDDANFLQQHLMVKNVKVFDYDKLDIDVTNNNSAIKFSINTDNAKYYTILDNYNPSIITNIVKSFYYACSQDSKNSLYLFINTDDNQNHQKCAELLQQIRNELHYKSNQSNIEVIVKSLTINDICGIHAGCDYYLDLRLSNNSSIYSYIAKKLKKPRITLDMVVSDGAPVLEDDMAVMGPILPQISYALLISHLQSVTKNKDKYIDNTTYSNIDELICQLITK